MEVTKLKRYEQFSQIKTIPNMPLILRIDGRSFSNYTKKLLLEKPFDERLRNIFIEVSKDLMNEFNPKYIYSFSDEINILFNNIPFEGRIEKIDSVLASFVSSSFMKHLLLNKEDFNVDMENLKPASFDCRLIQIPEDTKRYFKYRQDEAWRNCLNSYAQSILNKNNSPQETAKKLFKLNKSQINDLLFDNGININDVPLWQKRGISVYRIFEEKEGINPKNNKKNISRTSKIYIDLEVELIKLDS